MTKRKLLRTVSEENTRNEQKLIGKIKGPKYNKITPIKETKEGVRKHEFIHIL